MTARSLTAALVIATVASPASAQLSTNPKLLAPFKAVVAKANESTVRVRADDKDVALGTVVYAEGFILTKASELRGVLSVRLSDGTEYEAKVVATHVPADLAMLKIDVADLKPITFGDAKKAPVGNWLAAAGPQTDPVAVGIVSHAPRPLVAANFPEHLIDNFNRGYLGIELDLTDPKDKDGKVIGAKIAKIDEKGGAKKGGLKEKDVIIEVNGKKVTGRVELRDALENSRPGDAVKLKVLREEEEKDVEVKLTEQLRPDRSDIQNAMGGQLSGRRTGFPAVMQTDMVVAPKDCGGPVVDLEGNVLGVNIARAGRVETWILPGENIRPLLSDLKAGKSTAGPKKS